MDRRRFLEEAMYFTVAAAGATLTACGGGGGGSTPKGTFSFPLGVASGDPKESSVVFWTRCISASGDVAPISLQLEVSVDEAFDSAVISVPLNAAATYDFTVRAKVTQLIPDTRYFYRFVAGNDISASEIGRAHV